jgi:hypothetical protein
MEKELGMATWPLSTSYKQQQWMKWEQYTAITSDNCQMRWYASFQANASTTTNPQILITSLRYTRRAEAGSMTLLHQAAVQASYCCFRVGVWMTDCYLQQPPTLLKGVRIRRG